MVPNINANLATEAQKHRQSFSNVFISMLKLRPPLDGMELIHNQTTCGAVIASTFKDPLTSRRIMTKIIQKIPPHMRYFFQSSRARTDLNYEIKD